MSRREVAVEMWNAGASHAEIAAHFGVSRNASTHWIAKARQRGQTTRRQRAAARPHVTLICPNCGREYAIRYSAWAIGDMKRCSRACWVQYRRRPEESWAEAFRLWPIVKRVWTVARLTGIPNSTLRNRLRVEIDAGRLPDFPRKSGRSPKSPVLTAGHLSGSPSANSPPAALTKHQPEGAFLAGGEPRSLSMSER